jgi:hypothetical protein
VSGDQASAVTTLRDALAIRRERDPVGAKATQRNLDFILGPPDDWHDNGHDDPPPEPHIGRWVAVAVVVLVLGLIAGLALAGAGEDGDDNAAHEGTPTATRTATATKTATKTPPPITASITAPEALEYAAEDVPAADFACTGEPDACTGIVTGPSGDPVAVNDGDELPAEAGEYTLKVSATVGDDEADSDSVTYTVARPPVPLTVVHRGVQETTRVVGSGIDCGETCTVQVAPNTDVELTAQALDEATQEWQPTGAKWNRCSGFTATCTVNTGEEGISVTAAISSGG